MKKLKILPLFLIVCVVVSLAASPCAMALPEPEITVNAALVMNSDTGEIFYTKNAEEMVYPASLTKMMTVMLAVEAIERGDVSLYDEVTASANITYDLLEDGSSAGITVGEIMTLENLLYCAMVSSANEACNIIAEHVAGDIPSFIRMMNDRAVELGCTATNFTNTHGLPDVSHYTTARDFALIAAEAMKSELFVSFCNKPTVTIPETNFNTQRILNNSNALICDSSIYGSGYIYENAIAGKTGHTSAAGYCLASTASKNNINILTLVFGGEAIQNETMVEFTNFKDTITLSEWVFNNYSYQEILKSTDIITTIPVEMGADSDTVSLRPESSLTALLPNDYDLKKFTRSTNIYSSSAAEALTAPINAGEVLGEISLEKDGVNYGTVRLVASSTVELSRTQYIKNELMSVLSSKPVKIVFWSFVGLIFIYLVLVIRYKILHARYVAARKAQRAAAAKAAAAKNAAVHPVPKTAHTPEPPSIDYFKANFSDSEETAEDDEDLIHIMPDGQSEKDYFEEFFRKK